LQTSLESCVNNSARLERLLSYILRHNPSRYRIRLDRTGWASIDDVLGALRTHADFGAVCEQDIENLVQNSLVARFQIAGKRIRSLYGHSVQVVIDSPPKRPPEFLFHASSTRHLANIQREGLSPMRRRFVHLTSDAGYATDLMHTLGISGILFRISAQMAEEYAYRFWQVSEVVWLSEYIPPRFLQFGFGKPESDDYAQLISPEKDEAARSLMQKAIAEMFSQDCLP
jgi:putative RNA 2'-phosphotransferase